MKKTLFSSLLTAFCLSASAQFFAPNGTVSATTNPATNNVGIGKSTPSTRLDVNGTFQVYPSGNAGMSGALKLQVVPGPSSTMIQANSDLSWANHDISQCHYLRLPVAGRIPGIGWRPICGYNIVS